MGRPGVDKRAACALVPRVLQEVGACDVGEEHRHVVQRFEVGIEVSTAVVPYAIAVEARGRGTCRPQFVIVFQHGKHFVGIDSIVVQQQGALENYAHILLPEVVVEDMVFLCSAMLGVVPAKHAHHQLLDGGAFVRCQPVIELVVDTGIADGNVGRGEVGREQQCVAYRVCKHLPEQPVHAVVVFVVLCQVPSVVERLRVYAQCSGIFVRVHRGVVGIERVLCTTCQHLVFAV